TVVARAGIVSDASRVMTSPAVGWDATLPRCHRRGERPAQAVTQALPELDLASMHHHQAHRSGRHHGSAARRGASGLRLVAELSTAADAEGERRNAYWRLFGMDLAHGTEADERGRAPVLQGEQRGARQHTARGAAHDYGARGPGQPRYCARRPGIACRP